MGVCLEQIGGGEEEEEEGEQSRCSLKEANLGLTASWDEPGGYGGLSLGLVGVKKHE